MTDPRNTAAEAELEDAVASIRAVREDSEPRGVEGEPRAARDAGAASDNDEERDWSTTNE